MRQDYDSAYKAFYERLFQRWQIPVETQVEVSRQARAIDVVSEYIEILFQVSVEIDPETLAKGVRQMAEMHPEYKANLERALEILFEFSPESMERIAPFRRELNRALQEQRKNDKREVLTLLLQSRFGALPQTLVSQINTIDNIDELDGLYRRALSAQTLSEVGLQGTQ